MLAIIIIDYIKKCHIAVDLLFRVLVGEVLAVIITSPHYFRYLWASLCMMAASATIYLFITIGIDWSFWTCWNSRHCRNKGTERQTGRCWTTWSTWSICEFEKLMILLMCIKIHSLEFNTVNDENIWMMDIA